MLRKTSIRSSAGVGVASRAAYGSVKPVGPSRPGAAGYGCRSWFWALRRWAPTVTDAGLIEPSPVLTR